MRSCMRKLANRPELWEEDPRRVQKVIGGKLRAVRRAQDQLRAIQAADDLVAHGAWLSEGAE